MNDYVKLKKTKNRRLFIKNNFSIYYKMNQNSAPKPRIPCTVCGVPYIATSKPTHQKSRKHLIGAQMLLAAKLKSEAIQKANESTTNKAND